MPKIMRLRYSYPEKDTYINRTVYSPEEVTPGILMGTFKAEKKGLDRHCIRAREGEMWFEVDSSFPLVKVYEELFD